MIVIVPILIGVAAAAIGSKTMAAAIASSRMEKMRKEEQAARAAANKAQQAKRADAQARQRRKQAQVDRLVSQYGLPTNAKSELATWTTAGDAGIKRIERALAAGTSDTAKKLRNHDKRRRELLALRDEICKVSLRSGE